MRSAGIVTLIYGIIVLLGGVMGHLKAASTASLVVGGLSGLLLIAFSFGMLKRSLFFSYFALLLTSVLQVFFLYRLLVTLKFFPSGMMALVTAVTLILQALLIRRKSRI